MIVALLSLLLYPAEPFKICGPDIEYCENAGVADWNFDYRIDLKDFWELQHKYGRGDGRLTIMVIGPAYADWRALQLCLLGPAEDNPGSLCIVAFGQADTGRIDMRNVANWINAPFIHTVDIEGGQAQP